MKQREKINAQRRAFIDPRRFHIIIIIIVIVIIIIVVIIINVIVIIIIVVIIIIMCLYPQLCSNPFCLSGTKLSAAVKQTNQNLTF